MCGFENTLITVIAVVGGTSAFGIFVLLCGAAAVRLHDRKKRAEGWRAER